MRHITFILALVGLATTQENIPLNQYAMIMSHDAATGYLKGGLLHPVNNWAKTQGGAKDATQAISLFDQLECGTRAFDLRPEVFDGFLGMHHGSVFINHSFSVSVQEIISWLAGHPDELVVVDIFDCKGPDCWEMTVSTLSKLNLAVLPNCSCLDGATVGSIKSSSRLPSGGSLLLLNSCMVDNYDPSIKCYGTTTHSQLFNSPHFEDMSVAFSRLMSASNYSKRGADLNVPVGMFILNSSKIDFSCYGSWRNVSLQMIDQYIKKITSSPPPVGALWMTQGHWQYDEASIEAGLAHFSSIVDDEMLSNLNEILVTSVDANEMEYLNLLEVDFVCDRGPKLLQAVQAHNQRTALKISNKNNE
eukprot:c9778_g1_i1.p1 GENE.c9778_g1_i1~~c9778_g1_i1.p1  ORF type:complete len:361 (+),score=62.58 c9778_g1_i1:163-1245(+)